MKRALFPLLLIAVFVLSSCDLPFTVVWNTPAPATAAPAETEPVLPATSEPVVVTTEAPTAAPTLEGVEKNLGGVYMVLPPCLATDATGVIVPEENPGADYPPFAYNPEYRKITLVGYPLSGKFWEPVISVYPVAEFNTLVGSDMVNTQVTNLQALLTAHSLGSGSYPFLPYTGAAQVFQAQASFIDFQNGSGVGFLTEMAQYSAPVNNTDMFYTFQGTTSDGVYWVTITLPATAPFLQPSSTDMTVPADGIAMPDYMTASTAELEAYYTNVVARLNAASVDEFTPSLACIVSFIETLNIGD